MFQLFLFELAGFKLWIQSRYSETSSGLRINSAESWRCFHKKSLLQVFLSLSCFVCRKQGVQKYFQRKLNIPRQVCMIQLERKLKIIHIAPLKVLRVGFRRRYGT